MGYLLLWAVFMLIKMAVWILFLSSLGFLHWLAVPMLWEIVVRLSCNDCALKLIYTPSSGSSSGMAALPSHHLELDVNQLKIIVNVREGNQAIL